jgi:nucleotide-binding universal stress UspA family protein
MTVYQRAAVASTFSPTFGAVLAEAGSFARHCGAGLEIIHAAAFDAEKERRFLEKVGREAAIRWVEKDSPAQAIISAAQNYDYELLIAGALEYEDADKPFTSSVARELMRDAPCDLLLVPRPLESPEVPRRVVFALEPGEEDIAPFIGNSMRLLRPEHVTIAVTETPFAAAIAASRGEEPQDVEAWLEQIAALLSGGEAEIETRIVRSNTGYSLCDVIQGLEPDLLVVRALPSERGGTLPLHVDWLYQVIPTRLLVAKQSGRNRNRISTQSFSALESR